MMQLPESLARKEDMTVQLTAAMATETVVMAMAAMSTVTAAMAGIPHAPCNPGPQAGGWGMGKGGKLKVAAHHEC